MGYEVDWKDVSTVGLESSPVVDALAGLRANEARYFANKYDLVFTTEVPGDLPEAVDRVSRALLERDIVIASPVLEAATLEAGSIRFDYLFYESGLSVNLMHDHDEPKKRAIGFKLSDGMEIPDELAEKFKFARQRSKLAGTIRGSYFVVKGEY